MRFARKGSALRAVSGIFCPACDGFHPASATHGPATPVARKAPICTAGYAFASSRRYPREPETVCYAAEWVARYSWVGTARIDGATCNAFRRQGKAPLSEHERGARYLFQEAHNG